MKNLTITCPECNHEFSPNQALKHQLDHLMQEERTTLEAKFAAKEKEVDQRQQDLNKKENSIEQLIGERLLIRTATLKAHLAEKVKAEYSTEVEGLRKELEEKQLKLNKSKQVEIELERFRRETKEREDAIKLHHEKELNSERLKIESAIVDRETERHEMKLAERDKQLNDLKKQVDEMKRKVEQGSMQTQGEVQEMALEELLTELFKFDSIHEVPKGQNGADTIQIVRTPYGKECGIIAYESKRTKNFNEGWINKLKEDMREHHANHGILVTEVMPKDMPTFGLRNGIWVCTLKEISGLASVIRQICLIETSIKSSEVNRTEKIQALYNYLMSNEFKRNVEAILDAASEMRQNIDKERRSMLASWKKQEKNIDQMGFLMTDIIGSIDGISGNTLGPIQGLGLIETSEAA